MSRILVRAASVLAVVLILLSGSGCSGMVSRPKSKAELLQLMKSKYKKITRLSYRERHEITHDDITINSQIWESPPFSITIASDQIFLNSDKVSYSLYYERTFGRKTLSEIVVGSVKDTNEDREHPVELLSSTLSAVSQKHLVYQGVKRKGLYFYYTLKGKPTEELGVKEIWIDPKNLLPVKIVSEGEDLEDEIQNFSNYQINPSIDQSRFRIGLPKKTAKFVRHFTDLNRLPNLAIEDKSANDFEFDLYYPSKPPNGYRLTEVEIMRTKVSGTVGNFTYELPSISFEFQNTKGDSEIVIDIAPTNDEKVLKADLIGTAGEGVDLNSPLSDIIAAIGQWETLKETTLRPGKVHYWLSEGKFSRAVIKTDKNWLYISPIYDQPEEQFFLDFADTLSPN